MKFAILTIAALIGSTQAIKMRMDDFTKHTEPVVADAKAEATPAETSDLPVVGGLEKDKIEAMMEALPAEAKTYIEDLIKLIPADKLPVDEIKK